MSPAGMYLEALSSRDEALDLMDAAIARLRRCAAERAKRVLVVLGDLALRRVYAEALTSEGYRVTSTGTAASASAALAETDFEVVVIEPGLEDGWDFVERLPLDVRLVLLSDLDTEPAPRISALRLTKPVGVDTLVAAVG